MSWVNPSVRQTGDLITAAIWNQEVVDNTQFLYDSNFHGYYDSGWFAVALGTDYTKAHGLGGVPRLIVVWHSNVASPSGSTEVYRVTGGQYDAADDYNRDVIGVNDTTIYIKTPTGHVVSNMRNNATSGYYRVLAWL